MLDTSPAFSPPVEFNMRARYDWTVGQYKPFVWAGANHIGSQRSSPASFPSGYTAATATPTGCLDANGIPTTTLCGYRMPGYTTYDGAIGVSKDRWTVQGTGSNLGNSHASTYTSSGQFIEGNAPLRPRVLMLMFSMKFGGETPAAPPPPPAAAPRRPLRLRDAAAASSAAPAAAASSAGAGGSAPGRDLRDELGEAPAGIGLDS